MDKIQAYQVLGVNSNASLDEIRQAYKDLVRVWQPDQFANDTNLYDRAVRQMSDIDLAFDVLIGSFTGVKPSDEPTQEISLNADRFEEQPLYTSLKTKPLSVTLVTVIILLAVIFGCWIVSPVEATRIAVSFLEPDHLFWDILLFAIFGFATKNHFNTQPNSGVAPSRIIFLC